MRKQGWLLGIVFLLAAAFMFMPQGSLSADEDASSLSTVKTLNGEVNREVKQLYDGVISTYIEIGADSPYGLQKLTVVEFDMAQKNLYFDVTGGAQYANQLRTVADTVTAFNEKNADKTVIAAVNGDMWMVSYAHARYEGCYLADAYKSYANDIVVTRALTLPRGFNMYDGEIISSPHMTQETPFEGEFWSFGVTNEYVPILGNPQVGISVKNVTADKTVKADGLNRLPANNALVMYSDKGCLSNYSIDNAYEVVIDCDEDYTVKHGAVIKGTVTAIAKSGDENPSMKENRIILTARGNKVKNINTFNIGDTIEISISVSDKQGNDELWQNAVNAVGGHMQFAVDGVMSDLGQAARQPITIIGFRNDGKILFISNDGRQSATGWSAGFLINQYDELGIELDLNSAFIVDGGGSTTLVELAAEGYELKNRPSDKFENGDFGQPRTVVNSVIVSYGPEREAQGQFDIITQTNLSDFYNVRNSYMALTAAKQLTKSRNEDGTASLTMGGTADPNINVKYGSISADLYKYATLRLKATTDKAESDFGLYLCSGNIKKVADGTPRASFTLKGDSSWHTYLVDLSTIDQWGGTLNSIRLDPFDNDSSINAGDIIDIEYIKLFKTLDEARADRHMSDPQPVRSISVSSLPSALTVDINGQINTEGLTLTVVYEDEYSEVISSGFTVEADTSKAGETQAVVTYEGQTVSYNITVNAAASTSGGLSTVALVAIIAGGAVAIAIVVGILLVKKKS